MDSHRAAFVAEAEDGITDLNNALLALEADPEDAEAMDDVFRVAHTLKGNAAAMGYEGVSDFGHALEDLLDAVRQGDREVTPELMDLLFEGSTPSRRWCRRSPTRATCRPTPPIWRAASARWRNTGPSAARTETATPTPVPTPAMPTMLTQTAATTGRWRQRGLRR